MQGDTVNLGGTCTPNCVGKVCGSDGCGGSCGTCLTNQTCASGQCTNRVPECTTRRDCMEFLQKCDNGECKIQMGLIIALFIIILISKGLFR